MASVDMKVQILRRSISSLNRWLEASQQLLAVIPMELEANSQLDRRELALKYKDHLLQIREKCQSMQEINSLYQEIDSHDKSQQLETQLAEISASIAELNRQFTNTCVQAKKQYTKLAEKISATAPSSPAFSTPVASSPVSSTARAGVDVTARDACNLGQSKDKQGPIRPSCLSTGPVRPHSASNDHPRPSTPSNGMTLLSSSSSLGSGSPLPVPRSLTAPSSPKHFPAPPPQSQLGVSLSCEKLSLTSAASSPFPSSRKAVSSEGLADEGGQWDTLSTQSSLSIHSMRSLQNRVISGFGTSTDSLDSGPLEGNSHDSNTNLLEGISPCEGSGVRRVYHQRHFSGDSVQSLGNTPPVVNPMLPQFSPRAAHPAQPVELVRPNKLIMSSQSLPLAQPAKSPVQSTPPQSIRSVQQPNQSNQQSNQSNQQPNQSNQQPNQSARPAQPVELVRPNKLILSSQSLPLAQPAKSPVQSTPPQSIRSVQQPNQSNQQPNQSNQQPNQSNQQPNQSNQQPNQSNQQPNQSNQQTNQSVQQPNQSNQQPSNQSVRKPMQDAEELKTLLAHITNQVQDCIHNMTQHKGCALDRAVMEQHIAEIKGILSILDTQESMLFQLLATFSPSVRRKLTVDPATPTCGYPATNVLARKDEIVKLSDRVDLLSHHCKQDLAQVEGVLAMVTQHASQVAAILEDLGVVRSGVESVKRKGVDQAEECWDEIRKAKMALDSSKQKMATLGQLSLKLLQLEPTYDGTAVRREQECLSKEYQSVAPAVTELVETLGKARVERLLLDIAVVVSWVTMKEMVLHSGEEEPSLEEAMKDVTSHQHTIASLISDLQDVLTLTPLDGFAPVQEVRSQARDLTHSLASIEQRLKGSSPPHKDSLTQPGGVRSEANAPSDPLTTPPPTPPGYDRVPIRFSEPLLRGDGRGAQTILYDVPPATRRDTVDTQPQVTLHGDLLIHIANEWMGLCDETPSPEDTRDIMDCIGKVPSPEQRARLHDLLQTLYGMTRSLQDVLVQISAVKIPTQPSLEKIHASLDECQRLHAHLNTTSNLLDTLSSQSLPLVLLLPRTPEVLRLSLLLEMWLFDSSLLHCRATQRLQSLDHALHLREQETNSLYREVHKLSSTVLEGAKVLASGEEVMDATEYIEKCKALHSTLSSLFEKRLALNAQMREWSVSDPRSLICGKLMEELGNVDREWDRVLTGLSEVPKSEASLFRQMVRNILKEVVAMEANLPQLQSRTVELKQVTEKLETCAKYLEQSKIFRQSLKAAKRALRDANSPSPQATVPLETCPSSPIRRAQMPASENGNTKNGNGPATLQKGSVRPPTLVEMVITPRGPALTAPHSPAHTRDQCHSVMAQVEQLISSLEATLEVLRRDQARLEGFYGELLALENWLTLMRSSALPKDAMAGSGVGCADQVIGKQVKFEALLECIPEVMSIPEDEEGEEKKLERRVLTLYLDWDEVCLKYLPPGILPLFYSPFTIALQAPTRFEDVSQMVEWLILIESKLQPEKMVVGDFSQLRGMLHMLQIVEREMKSKQAEYLSFMKGETEGPEDLASSTPLPKGTSLTPNKCVKFVDENTLQRVRRKQEIKSLVAKPHQEGARGETTSSPPLTRDPTGSMATSPHASATLDSPTSSLAGAETWQYQLSLLWKGIGTTLGQWRQRLELVQDIWKAFESRKEAMVTFMCGAEGTMKTLLPSLNCAKDFEGLDAVISQYKRLTEDVSAYDQKLSTLRSLASNLLNHHHSADDTKEFQATMDAINQQWSDLKDNLAKLQGVLEPLSVQWTSFYSLYNPFTQWLSNMDFEMASMNPFVSDMATIQSQLDKQKEIQQQVTFKEGTLEKIQAQGSKLLQGAGGSYISPSVMHKKLEGMAKIWSHIQKFAKERSAAFEQAMAAKQETLAQLSKCLLWLSQAEKHLASQKPLGMDFSQVHTQYEAHQAFWKDVLNQKPQMDSLAASGRFAGREASKGKTTAECVSLECTQSQFASLQERWKALLANGERWGELLEKALPEMEKLQSLRIECAHRLSEAEAKINGLEAISNKFLVLIRQLDSIKELEMKLGTLGDLVGVASMSQQRLLELGVSPNATCMELVSKMVSRFEELKQMVASRHVTIEKAMMRFESSAGMAPLPDGWHRAKTEKGTPYYIQAGIGNLTQWQHPELSELYKEMQSMYTLPFYPTTSYPVALKLRVIQKKTRFEVLSLQHVTHCYKDNPKGPLTASEMATYTQAMFQHVEAEFADKMAMSKAIELTASWIRDVFDKSHEGMVSMTSFQIATICMSNGKLDNKYRSLFKVISLSEDGATPTEIANFLQEMVQISLSCSSTPSQNGTSQMIDTCAQDCFKKYGSAGKLSLVKFLQWVQTEPEPVAWLPILHRLVASDSVQHNVTCTACRMHPIVGFRYRCMDCVSLDLCQECYWAGKSTKEHDKSTHYMEEYCIAKEEGKDFLLKALRKSLRKKRDEVVTQEVPSPGPGRTAKGSPAIKKRHSTYIETPISETDELEIRSKPSIGATYFTPPPTRRAAANLLSEPLPSSPPLPIRTRLASLQKNSPTELDHVVPSPPPLRGQPKGPITTSPPLLSPPPQPYMTPLPQQANALSNGVQARPGPTPPRITTESNQLLNGGYAPNPQGAAPEGSYNPYGVHTHHRTARGTVTTTTTVC